MSTSSTTVRPTAGQRVGEKYRLLRALDEGGMGTIWEGVNTDLAIAVAIKVVRPELVGSAAAERLVQEARVLARLDHPGIIRVFDCGQTEDGAPYVVMELLRGECLADTLNREGALNPIRAASLLLPIAEAIDVAHLRGVVHRDLKPENIFLAELGRGRIQPKVLDFGIARSDVTRNMRLTIAGSLIGSPEYMAPEQARGSADVDGRADVWALSIVLYEAVTGISPFKADNYNATLNAIIEDEPPSLVDMGIGDALLASIVERGLRKNPAQRWQSMHDLGVALAQWLYSQGVSDDAASVSLRAAWLDRSSSAPPVALSTPPPVVLPPKHVEQRRAPGGLVTGSTTPAPPSVPALSVTRAGMDSEPRLSGGVALTYPGAEKRSGWRVAVYAAVAAALGMAIAAGTLRTTPATDSGPATVAARAAAVEAPREAAPAPIPSVTASEPAESRAAPASTAKKPATKAKKRFVPRRAPSRR